VQTSHGLSEDTVKKLRWGTRFAIIFESELSILKVLFNNSKVPGHYTE
jgi:hypothetical protein